MAADRAGNWPAAVTDRLSRAEICRRYILAGMPALKNAMPADQAAILTRFQMSIPAPNSEKLKH
jgi:hypothetical protein